MDLGLTLAEEALADRRERGPDGAGTDAGISDREAYPKLCELLTVLPPGSKGITVGRIGIFVQHSKLTCVLSYPAISGCAFIALDGFQDALTKIERKMQCRDVEWRTDKPKTGYKKF